jgi:hypothetical protein
MILCVSLSPKLLVIGYLVISWRRKAGKVEGGKGGIRNTDD